MRIGTLNSAGLAIGSGPFVPTDIAGIQLWLNPETITQAAGVITAWTDASGNGNDTTPVSSPPFSANLLDGYGGFLGAASGYFNLPNAFSGLTAGESFFVTKVGAGSLINGLHNFGGLGELYPYVDGNIYEDFGTTVRKSCGAPVLSITANHRVFNVRSAAGAWSAFINKTQQFTTAVNIVGWSTTPRIGKADGSNAFTGSILEVIVYNKVLAATERASVWGYLGRKYPTIGL